MEIILNSAEVAFKLRCSIQTIKKMVREGNIPYFKCAKGLRFVLAEIEDLFFLGASGGQQNHFKLMAGGVGFVPFAW